MSYYKESSKLGKKIEEINDLPYRYICGCGSQLKNTKSNIYSHLNGERHLDFLGIPKCTCTYKEYKNAYGGIDNVLIRCERCETKDKILLERLEIDLEITKKSKLKYGIEYKVCSRCKTNKSIQTFGGQDKTRVYKTCYFCRCYVKQYKQRKNGN